MSRAPRSYAAATELAPHIVSSAVPPANTRWVRQTDVFRFASINLGWDFHSQRHTPEWLCDAVEDVIQARALDALGLSEIFEIDNNSLVAITRKQKILQIILMRLNSKDSAGQPSWTGRLDIHSIFIWKRHLNRVHAELVSCGINVHEYRKAQYLQFHPAEAKCPIHTFHTHSPSSKKRKLTLERKKYVLRNLWNHAMMRHRAISGSAAQSAEPSVIFMGDYNLDLLEWTTCLACVSLSTTSSAVHNM